MSIREAFWVFPPKSYFAWQGKGFGSGAVVDLAKYSTTISHVPKLPCTKISP